MIWIILTLWKMTPSKPRSLLLYWQVLLILSNFFCRTACYSQLLSFVMVTERWLKCLSSPPIFFPSRDKERFVLFNILEAEAGASKDTQENHWDRFPSCFLKDTFHINSLQNHWHPRLKGSWNLFLEVAHLKRDFFFLVCVCWKYVLGWSFELPNTHRNTEMPRHMYVPLSHGHPTLFSICSDPLVVRRYFSILL